MNLLCGVLGVIFSFKGEIQTAFILMMAAAVFDFADGLAARALKAYSEMGKELDSLSDMISFGVLPALMLYNVMEEGWLRFIPLFIAVMSGLRLAKFNIDERQTHSFLGLPTPACAMLCGSLACYTAESPYGVLFSSSWIIPAVAIVLGILLVSELPMFSLKYSKDDSKSLKQFRIIFLLFSALLLLGGIFLGSHWSIGILYVFAFYLIYNVSAWTISKCSNRN